MLRLEKANLLEVGAEALVNTVNTVGVSGKGVALQFRQAFPDNYEAYRRAAKRGGVAVGTMFVFDRGTITSPRYIINFPTKRHWKGRSRIEDIEAGLDDLVRVVRRLEIHSIALPALGCGNGGLNWSQVEPLIRRAFDGLPDVDAILIPPGSTPSQDSMPVRTSRPEWTPTRAALIAALGRYARSLAMRERRISALEAQKLAYLLQALGEPMRLRFSRQQYGPYSEQLNHVLQRLEGHYLRGYGDRTEGMKLWVPDEALREAEDYLAASPTSGERLDRLVTLLEGFESPYGLELLATTHWVVEQSPEHRKTADNAVQGVQEWSPRKRGLFETRHVEIAFARLGAVGLVPPPVGSTRADKAA